MDRTSCLISKLYQATNDADTNGINRESSPHDSPSSTIQTGCCICAAALTVSAQGCSSFTFPKTVVLGQAHSEYQGVDSSYDGGQTSVSEAVYHAVRRAKAENGVVLQVVGGEIPAEVLPLPPDNHAVYVSELLSRPV